MRLSCALIGLALLVPVQRAAAPPLQSFYVGRVHTSDFIPGWNRQVLEAVPEGGGVRVRLIQVALANTNCDRILVQAVEARLPDTTVEALAGQNLCSLDYGTVAKALAKARGRAPAYEPATTTVVPMCGLPETVLDFPQGVAIDWKTLERRSPAVAAAGQLFDRLRERAFGKDFTFDTKDAAKLRQLDALGTAVVEDVVSGRFATVMDVTFTKPLIGYAGPPSRELLPAELLEQADLTFDTYVPVRLAPIALTARTLGDLHLRLSVDRATGAVTDVKALSGHALLRMIAEPTVRRWRFAPASLSADVVDVTLRFQPRC